MDAIEASYQSIVDGWRARRVSTVVELRAALGGREIATAYNSGKIENPAITYAHTRDVFEDGIVRSFTGDPRALFEIQNLKACQDRLARAFEAREPLSEALALEVQRILCQGTYDEARWAAGERPGSYRRHEYVVGPRDTGAFASEVPGLVTGLLDEVNAADEGNDLTVAAYFHASFEEIHPFADGNGRTGRALLNYLLLLRDHPPITIYDDDRLAYFGALESWDATHDLAPMKAFLQAECLKTWL